MESPLEAILHAFLDPSGDDIARWRALVDEIRPRRARDTATARDNLQALTYLLARETPLREALAASLQRLVNGRKLISLFASAGLLPSTGFFSEAARRLGGRLLPDVCDLDNLKDALGAIFHRSDDEQWVCAIPDELWCELLLQLMPPDRTAPPPLPSPAMLQLTEALRVLSYHVSSLGLDPELLRVDPGLEQHASPFLAQNAEVIALLEHWSADDMPNEAIDERQVMVLLAQCGEVVQRIRRRSARLGTSLSLTFKLERLQQLQGRLLELVALLAALARHEPGSELAPRFVSLFKQLVHAECRRHSLSDHWGRNAALLSLRVTENAGRKGEHYITASRSEYWELLRSAAGAGVIIALMAAIKVLIARQGFAPLNEALLICLNYGLGFVLIHLLHFTVATKQPAMTANAIAASLGEASGKVHDLERLAELIVRTLRSQFAAILGNILLAVPVAMGVALAIQHFTGTHFVTPHKAQVLLADASPLQPGNLAFASIAGVCLFLAGLITGYYDNLCAYNRIPERLRQLRWLRRLLGENRLARVADYVENNLGALAGNFFFGFLLGGVGAIGVLFGLPLDIRHIAFASALSGYAAAALDFSLSPELLMTTAAGIALIGMLNLAVSFSLALGVALRSRNVGFAQSRQLLRSLARRALRAPRDLLFPPPDTAPHQEARTPSS